MSWVARKGFSSHLGARESVDQLLKEPPSCKSPLPRTARIETAIRWMRSAVLPMIINHPKIFSNMALTIDDF
jgi:hypothetical protein